MPQGGRRRGVVAVSAPTPGTVERCCERTFCPATMARASEGQPKLRGGPRRTRATRSARTLAPYMSPRALGGADMLPTCRGLRAVGLRGIPRDALAVQSRLWSCAEAVRNTPRGEKERRATQGSGPAPDTVQLPRRESRLYVTAGECHARLGAGAGHGRGRPALGVRGGLPAFVAFGCRVCARGACDV